MVLLLVACALVLVSVCDATHTDKPSLAITDKRAHVLLKLWDGHIATEFAEKSADAAVATMVPEASVLHVPTLTGGKGTKALRKFYATHFIPKMPPDVSLVPVSRAVGNDLQGIETITDEFIFQFTHTVVMDWMLPGIKPTGRKVRVPFVVIIKFKGNKLLSERIYWDQATVLQQLGLLPADTPGVSGVEQADKVADFRSVPSNAMIPK